MKYDEWIERERRTRVKILKSSPVIQREHAYMTCQDCSELCLCHEECCPNCGSRNIVISIIENDAIIWERIRCKHRFMNLEIERDRK